MLLLNFIKKNIGFPSLILALSVFTGQLIRVPIGTHGGVSLLDLTVIVLVFYGLFRSKLKISPPPLFVKISLIFTIIAVISLIFTPLQLSSREYLTSFFYTVRFFSFIILGWLIYSNVYPGITKNASNIILGSGFILAILGIFQFIFIPNLSFLADDGWDGHLYRAVSTFLDPNFYGGFLTLSLLAIIQKFPWSQKSKIIIFAVIYLALLLTFSRSSYLMFLISFATLSILKRSIRFGLLTVFLFGGLLIGFSIYQKQVATPRNIDRVQSAKYRIDSWQEGLEIYSKNLALGVGYNSYRYALREYNLGPQAYIESHGASANDSSILEVASTTGSIGLATYLLLLWSILWQGYKTYSPKKPQGGILVSGLLGLIIHASFANSLFYPHLLIWIILLASSKPYEKIR